MENLNWFMFATVGVITCMAIGTLFVLGCIFTGSVQFIVSWIYGEYLPGIVAGLMTLVYIHRCKKEDERTNNEEA